MNRAFRETHRSAGTSPEEALTRCALTASKRRRQRPERVARRLEAVMARRVHRVSNVIGRPFPDAPDFSAGNRGAHGGSLRPIDRTFECLYKARMMKADR